MTPTPGGTPERPALFFADAAEWGAWLAVHHASEREVWVGLWKKHARHRGLVWEDAVAEALCWGWIDSTAQRLDEDATRQRWTPRRPGGNWSAVNLAIVERLTREGRMQPPGLAAHEARRPENERVYAYENPDLEWPDTYEAVLRSDAGASAFFDLAPASYQHVCRHWVMGARQESTRQRRLAELVADCADGRLIKSQRYGTAPAWVERHRTRLGLGASEGTPGEPGAI